MSAENKLSASLSCYSEPAVPYSEMFKANAKGEESIDEQIFFLLLVWFDNRFFGAQNMQTDMAIHPSAGAAIVLLNIAP